MTRSVSLTLPVPPTGNLYFRIWRGRAVKTKAAIQYGEAVGMLTGSLQRQGWPTLGGVAVSFRWYRAKALGDLDNRAKVLLDSLRGRLYHDDRQVRELHAWLDDSDKGNARIELEVRILP